MIDTKWLKNAFNKSSRFVEDTKIEDVNMQDCYSNELGKVLSEIVEHSLAIGRLLKSVNKSEYMKVAIVASSSKWSNPPIAVEFTDETIHHILAGTHTRQMNFCELNAYLQKKFNVEYEHRVYHTYSTTK